MTILLLSNNPLVLQKYQKALEVPGSLRDVLVEARNCIHRGHRLITHPLSGSIKPNETPYKSLLLSKGGCQGVTDFQSVQLIENALAAVDKLKPKKRRWSEKVLADFQLIDLSLLESAL